MHSAIVFASVLAVASAGLIAPGLTSSQYHAQDELGQYSYGYAGGPSAKSESKDAAGNVRGSYSYIDANGITQTVNYVADPVNGFRVAATNLPVGPAPAPVAFAPALTYAAAPALTYASAPAFAPVAVAHAPIHHIAQPVHVAQAASNILPGARHVAPLPIDTPEVQAAKINHFAAHNEALARAG